MAYCNPHSYQKIFLAIALLVVTSACSQISKVLQSSSGCPDQPSDSLTAAATKPVTLSDRPIQLSGQARAGESQGYIFTAETGQKLNYQTKSDVCIWVYAPDTQIVKGRELPQTGKYTLQVSAAQGVQTFDLSIWLGETSTLASGPSPSAAVYQFAREDFPQSICGDPRPTNPREYPVSFYPVNAPFSQLNLAKARSLFCRDAYEKVSQDTGDRNIQLASFTSQEKAQAFARFVSTEIPGAAVGSPTVVTLNN